MLLSTGMSTEEEVRRTLAFLDQCSAEYALFHCVSTYPAAPEEINLRFMERLREWSGRPVGYSGHDTGIAISLAAVAMGARLLERHLTLDRDDARSRPQGEPRAGAVRRTGARAARSGSCRSACRTAGSRAARRSTAACSARAWSPRPTFRRNTAIARGMLDQQESRARALAAVRRQAGRPAAVRARLRATRCSGSRTSTSRWPAARRPRSTSARRGASSRGSSTSRRSSRPSCRSACGSSSSTSAIAISTPAPSAYHGGQQAVRVRRARAGVLRTTR